VRQTGQETDKRFLDDVLAGRSIAQPAIDEREQSPLEPFDELAPGIRVASAYVPDQEGIGLCDSHRLSLPRDGFSLPDQFPSLIVTFTVAVCLSSLSRPIKTCIAKQLLDVCNRVSE